MKKTDFQNLHFEGGLQYTPVLQISQFAVGRDNLWHLWSYIHENLAQGLYLDLRHDENMIFFKFAF